MEEQRAKSRREVAPENARVGCSRRHAPRAVENHRRENGPAGTPVCRRAGSAGGSRAPRGAAHRQRRTPARRGPRLFLRRCRDEAGSGDVTGAGSDRRLSAGREGGARDQRGSPAQRQREVAPHLDNGFILRRVFRSPSKRHRTRERRAIRGCARIEAWDQLEGELGCQRKS